MSYGTTFPALRAAAGGHWPAYTRHAFVRSMGTGELPSAAFLHYLRQDYLFLIHFSRAWALAVTKAPDLPAMRACAATVHALLDEEMKLHVATCAAAGIPEAELLATPEAVECVAYTRFVLDCGHAGDFLDLLVALAPCVLGYGEIGTALRDEATSDAYADWIATYAGDEYQGVCEGVAVLIDRTVAERIGPAPEASPRWASLVETFATATRLEAAFWDMGLRGCP
ncbi:TenA family protein [Frigidibacter sp. MR17.14]|uniref:TenA family protein n=1 Tax=Frigidibacter sp. MR17.14 TaxID=3126509 RepID=UPI0030130D54